VNFMAVFGIRRKLGARRPGMKLALVAMGYCGFLLGICRTVVRSSENFDYVGRGNGLFCWLVCRDDG
jgi:hypothetical protein